MTPRLLKRFPALPFILLALIAVTAALGSFSCGKSDDEKLTDTSDIKKYQRPAPEQSHRPDNEGGDETAPDEEEGEESDAGTGNKVPVRKALLFPNKIYTDSTIEVRAELATPLKENQRLAYKFFKNGEAMEEQEGNTLPPRTCKKKDILFAEVLLYADDLMIASRRTPMSPVLNSVPDIREVIFPQVEGPGVYRFLVKASDTDDDQLTFSLETTPDAMPPDTQIDPATGTVSCTLDQNMGDSISFTLIADDGDGGVAKKIVTMRFFIRPGNEK